MNASFWIRAGAVSGWIAVAAGAFGAHGLRERLSSRMLDVFETAVKYQMYHALALLAVGLFAANHSSKALTAAGWGFLLGTLLFSGSLYAMALTGQTKLGMITPLGGLAFLAGWAALAVGADAVRIASR